MIYRIADEQPVEPTRGWLPFYVFVAVVLILLSLPTLDSPLWVRFGQLVVWGLQLVGIEFGPVIT